MRGRQSLALVALLASCGGGLNGGSSPSTGPIALYDTSPDRADFFAMPWPADSRLTEGDGAPSRIDLTGFPRGGGLVNSLIDALTADALGGFGTSSAIYFRFDAPIDPTSLPQTPADSILQESSVFVVDMTAGSPTFGQRSPVRVRVQSEAGLYLGSNAIALLPEPGFPLRERTTYAAVITDGVRGGDGERVRSDDRFDLDAILPEGGSLGVALDRVAVATVFTTQDATSTMRALREAVYRTEAPSAVGLAWRSVDPRQRYDLFHGTFSSPNFQEGEPPYSSSGGRIHFAPDGNPEPVRVETLRFALTVPHAEMPADGWPIVLYAHGTGGDYESFIRDGSAERSALIADADDRELGRLAMISIDQVVHGPRDPIGGDPNLTFFNLGNFPAARDNVKQGALDNFQLVRLVEALRSDSVDSKYPKPLRFDTNRIYFFGHSQGGLSGPLFLAFEPKVRAAVLSGAGANIILTILGKTEPVNIPGLVEALINESLDEYHPLLSLLQTYLESSDPGNYARHFLREPPVGQRAKSIFQTLGVVDHYTPVPSIKALALASGLTPLNPMVEPIDSLSLAGLTATDPPFVGSGGATGALGQCRAGSSYDGHFVVFRHPRCITQAFGFLGTDASSGNASAIKSNHSYP